MKAIISKNIRVRHPEAFEVGDFSIIDDFCYFSAQVKIGRGSHVASGCSVSGGKKHLFQLGDCSSLSSGVKIWCASNDFVNGLIAIFPEGVKDDFQIEGNVVMGDFSGIGSNSVVMPNNRIPEGTAIGALSFVPAGFAFEPWSVYAGNPLRKIKDRHRENVLMQAELVRRAWKKASS